MDTLLFIGCEIRQGVQGGLALPGVRADVDIQGRDFERPR